MTTSYLKNASPFDRLAGARLRANGFEMNPEERTCGDGAADGIDYRRFLFSNLRSTKGRAMNTRILAFAAALCLALCPALVSAVEVGDKAPDFDLPSTMSGKFKLSEQAGKKNVIVQFYVLDFTPT